MGKFFFFFGGKVFKELVWVDSGHLIFDWRHPYFPISVLGNSYITWRSKIRLLPPDRNCERRVLSSLMIIIQRGGS